MPSFILPIGRTADVLSVKYDSLNQNQCEKTN